MATNRLPFDLKADSFSFPTLYLVSSDMDEVEALLEQRLGQAPDFFRNTPMVIDLSRFAEGQEEVDFPMFVGLLRGRGVVPIGVRGGNPEQQSAAKLMELAILGEGRKSKRPPADEAPPEPKEKEQEHEAKQPPAPPPPKEPEPPAVTETLVITRPVRSGQKIYTEGDLIVLAQVSSGAELMADGNIHIYAALRGRVLAGVKGNAKARVFCQSLQAELVSVAGRYMLSEDYPPKMVGKAVQFYSENDRLYIQPL